jgi:hypothetical protein
LVWLFEYRPHLRRRTWYIECIYSTKVKPCVHLTYFHYFIIYIIYFLVGQTYQSQLMKKVIHLLNKGMQHWVREQMTFGHLVRYIWFLILHITWLFIFFIFIILQWFVPSSWLIAHKSITFRLLIFLLYVIATFFNIHHISSSLFICVFQIIATSIFLFLCIRCCFEICIYIMGVKSK